MIERDQLRRGFVAGIAEQVELFAIGDGDGSTMGKQHGEFS